MQKSLLDLAAEDPGQRLQSIRYASTNYHSLSANKNSLSRKVKHAIIGNKRKKHELANSGLIPRYLCVKSVVLRACHSKERIQQNQIWAGPQMHENYIAIAGP